MRSPPLPITRPGVDVHMIILVTSGVCCISTFPHFASTNCFFTNSLSAKLSFALFMKILSLILITFFFRLFLYFFKILFIFLYFLFSFMKPVDFFFYFGFMLLCYFFRFFLNFLFYFFFYLFFRNTFCLSLFNKHYFDIRALDFCPET